MVEPKHKIRNPIDQKFIEHHFTNAEENPEQRNRAPNPPFSPSEPTLEEVEKRITRHVLHVKNQQSSLCRFLMHLYHAMRDRANPEPFMTPKELSSYMNWPWDRPSSVGEENDNAEAQSTVGNVRKPAEEGIAKANAEDVVNAEETDTEAGAETAVEVVAKTVVEVVKKIAKTTVGVVTKKKDQPGPSRRTLRPKRAKTNESGSGSKPLATQYVISLDISSEETEKEETEKEDEGRNESKDEEESKEETERLRESESGAEEEYDTPSWKF